MKPTEKALWQAINDQALPLVKSLISLFLEPQKHFNSVNDYPSLSVINEDADDKSFFFPAIEGGNLEIINYLYDVLPKEAKLLTATTGQTALALAAERGYSQLCKRLIADGAQVNSLDDNAASPMSLAARNGHTSTVSVLLEAKADVNRPDKTGNTPLHYGCLNAHLDIVRNLLEAKALPFLKNNKGDTPLTLAYCTSNPNLIFILFTYGAAIASSLPLMTEQLVAALNTLLNNYIHSVFMLGTKNCAALTNVITQYNNFMSITFANTAQSYAIQQHCNMLLMEETLSVANLTDIGMLKEQLEIPSLVRLTAQYLRGFSTPKRVELLFQKMREKKNWVVGQKISLPNDLIETEKLQAFSNLMLELGYSEKPALTKVNDKPLIPLTVVSVVTATERVREKIESPLLSPFINTQREIKNLTEILQQLQQHEDVLNKLMDDHYLRLKIAISELLLLGKGLPFTLASICLLAYAILISYSSVPTMWKESKILGLIVVLPIALLVLLNVAILKAIYIFKYNPPHNFVLHALLSQSRDQLIAFLEEIQSELNPQSDFNNSQQLANIINDLRADHAFNFPRMLSLNSRVKKFFEAEQEQVSADLENQNIRYQYSKKVRFFPPSDPTLSGKSAELQEITSLGYMRVSANP